MAETTLHQLLQDMAPTGSSEGEAERLSSLNAAEQGVLEAGHEAFALRESLSDVWDAGMTAWRRMTAGERSEAETAFVTRYEALGDAVLLAKAKEAMQELRSLDRTYERALPFILWVGGAGTERPLLA